MYCINETIYHSNKRNEYEIYTYGVMPLRKQSFYCKITHNCYLFRSHLFCFYFYKS